MPSQIERTWSTVPQVVAAVAHVLTLGLFTWLPGVVTYWLWKGRSRYVAFNGLQSAYLSGFLFIVAAIGFVIGFLPFIGWIGHLAIGIAWITGLAFWVVGAIHSSRGETFEYPVVGRLARRAVGH